MHITALYAGLLAALLVWLSMGVVKARRAARVALGDGGDTDLQRAMRAHGNCAEYVPMALILMGLAEQGGVFPGLIHALGVVLLAGRALHAWGIRHSPENLRFRFVGMVLTYAVLVVGAAVDIWVFWT